ncbi:MAG: hypothetical protein CVU05_13160 [Bacteroidetes bacterium HGW-Bacteroidetes-21]|nr:MAG: hypothetical protein CVU05_13160 [Bacteroidetes bacterium HGW-Bacteroidetes-21]
MSSEIYNSYCFLPRNREIMRVFKDLDLVEQLGSGMMRILRFYKKKNHSKHFFFSLQKINSLFTFVIVEIFLYFCFQIVRDYGKNFRNRCSE